MATTTGIQGGTRPGATTSGLQELRSLGRDSAEQLLTQLGNNLNNRTGVVRLLHTSKADKEMTFKTAGGFKQLFLNGGKLEQSGRVIRDLLAQAGAKQDQLDAFDQYLQTRGNSGVQAQRIRQEIDKLALSGPKAVVALTENEALTRFGMQITTDANARVGEGGFGQVFSFEHHGKAMVYKQADGESSTWQLKLQDASGHLLKPRQEGGANSVVHIVDDPKAQLRAQNFAHESSNSIDSDASGQNSLIKRLLVEMPDVQESTSPKSVSLSREGLAIAARVKIDIPEAIAPSVYVIKETKPSGEEFFHAVGGGQQLKSWARQQSGDSALRVVSMVMPRAAGVQPLEYEKDGTTKGRMDPKDLKPMARSGLRGLQNFSKHGFIHGDIKPENMIWDAKTQTLRVIDLDGMRKISKKPGSEIPQEAGVTSTQYLHPMKRNQKASIGVGRDLFAFGLTLLETAAHSGGQENQVENFKNLQNYLTKQQAVFLAAREDGRREILNRLDRESQDYPADSVQHFALQAIKTAIEYEGRRLEGGEKSYDRWRADDALHPLNVLAHHPSLRVV